MSCLHHPIPSSRLSHSPHSTEKCSAHTHPSLPKSRGCAGHLALVALGRFRPGRLGAGALLSSHPWTTLTLPTGLSDSANSALTLNLSYPLFIILCIKTKQKHLFNFLLTFVTLISPRKYKIKEKTKRKVTGLYGAQKSYFKWLQELMEFSP